MEPNLSINPPKSGEESLGIRTLTESTRSSSIELRELREELKRRDEELERTKWQLKDIAERNKVFYQINLLPKELKHMVFARMSLFDRVAAAKASREMEKYFMENRLRGSNSIYLKKEGGKQYVKVVYELNTVNYTEMHRIPAHRVPLIQNELESGVGCKCQFCRDCLDGHDGKNGGVRYFRDGNLQEVFHTMRLFRTCAVDFKSSPVGGLVDLLQPIGKLAEKCSVSGSIDWHPKRSDYHIRNDPRVNMGNWSKWFEFWSFDEFHFCNENEGVYIHRDLFDLELVKNAHEVHSNCPADINFRQIVHMKGYLLNFEGVLDCVTPMDMVEICRIRIKEWMKGERDWYDYEFNCADNTDNPPHLDYRKVFADMEEELNPEKFRLYANAHPIWYPFVQWEKDAKSITIRNMKTNQCLGVATDQLFTGDVNRKESDSLPDYLRF